MVNLIREMGVPVKNHMSSIDDETIEKVRAKFEAEKEAVKHAEEEKKKRLEEARRKRRVVDPQKAEARVFEEAAAVSSAAGPLPAGKAVARAVSGQTAEAAARAGAASVATARAAEGGDGVSRGRRRRRRRRVDQAAVEENIRRTLAKIDAGTRRRRRAPKREEAAPVAEAEPANVLKVTEFVSVSELADLIGVPATQIIASCMELGLMVTLNQRLDFDTINVICEEFGFAAQRQDAFVLTEPEVEADEGEGVAVRNP